MNDDSLPPSDETHPDLPSDLIDQVCDRFEAAAREGRDPRIEDFLDSFPELNRLALLYELIGLELDLRRRTGETLTLDLQNPQGFFYGYYQRFPDAKTILDRLRNEWELKLAKQSDLVCPAVGFDPEIETIDHVKTSPPRHIKQFELQSILGRGGFGIVWLARDKRLQRDVALKVPRSGRLAAADRSMFLREARAAAKLRHPNIVAIHEVGEDDSEIFIVSELIDGVSLKVWLESHKIAPDAAAKMIAKLAQAVQHAHDKKIVHRDLKPANVLIDQQGEPHVADFGLAKREAGEESISIRGQIIGTPAYMAPEQARGDHTEIDARTDIYALGAIFYELLTGVRPFRGEVGIILEQVKNTTPEAPRLIKPEIPGDLEAICLKCLAKDRNKRYASAAALAEDLHLYLAGETLRGIPAALPNRLWKWFNRNRRYVSAIGLTFFVALTVAGSLAWQYRGTKPIPVDLREVEFTTKPEGCEITVVVLDPKSGEPDPTKIQHAKGRTPLTMLLEPADYLVVAVLDETRFHEVFRHVPGRDETVSFAHRHLYWKANSSGRLEVQSIKIPRSDVTVGMGLVEKSTPILEPRVLGEKSARSWLIPSFYVDPNENVAKGFAPPVNQERGAEEEGARNAKVPQLPLAAFSVMSYYDAVRRLEFQGKRLPSAGELYFLSNVVCPAGDDPEAACTLSDQSQIKGLHSGVWEWTSTKPNGPFTGMKIGNKAKGNEFLLRMIGGGSRDGDRNAAKSPFRSALEPHEHEFGVRGVRSAKPRRRPQDFIVPVGGVEVH
ncbi:MAG: hypothetical protein JWN70_3217 [Planctomycetaceae bacterium]|nr:hypothetical protein [Planctomycetaceae bacterium]